MTIPGPLPREINMIDLIRAQPRVELVSLTILQLHNEKEMEMRSALHLVLTFLWLNVVKLGSSYKTKRP